MSAVPAVVDPSHWSRLPYTGLCDQCAGTFDTPFFLRVHTPCFQRSHLYREHDPIDPAYYCEFCLQPFKSIDRLRLHIRFKLEKIFQCNLCSKKFTTKQHVERHVATRHFGIMPFPCTTEGCDVSYTHRIGLHRHYAATGHGADCIVESVEYLGDGSEVVAGAGDGVDEEEDAFYDSGEEDYSEKNDEVIDEDLDDPDYRPGSSSSFSRKRSSSRGSSCTTLAITNDSSQTPDVTRVDDEVSFNSSYNTFPMKRGRGRPRKDSHYPANLGRRFGYYLPKGPDASSSSSPSNSLEKKSGDSDLRSLPKPETQLLLPKEAGVVSAPTPGRRPRGRPPKHSYESLRNHPIITPNANLNTSTRTYISTRSQAVSPKAVAPNSVPAADSVERSKASSLQSRIELLTTIKHCSTCNAMFFQQEDYERHYSVHRPVVDMIDACSQTDRIGEEDEVVISESESNNDVSNLPGSNCEAQDSGDDADCKAPVPEVFEVEEFDPEELAGLVD